MVARIMETTVRTTLIRPMTWTIFISMPICPFISTDRRRRIPAFGGVLAGDEIHAHDASGKIHIHPQAPRESFVKLGEVFDKWKAAPQNANPNAVLTENNLLDHLEDDTHVVYMFVNGVRTDAFQNYQIHDGDEIILAYSANPVLTVNMNLGRVPIELFADKTPITVNNFLNYVNDGDYHNSFFHRRVGGFVLQGGGFKTETPAFVDPSVANQFTPVDSDDPIQNEFDNYAKVTGTEVTVVAGQSTFQLGSNVDLSQVIVGDRIRLTGIATGIMMLRIIAVDDAADTVTVSSIPNVVDSDTNWTIFPRVNVAGTLAMAKLGGNPDSATSQFFINLANNDANLDLQNGGFTVFGQILDESVYTDVSGLNDLALFQAELTGGKEVPMVETEATGSAILAFNNENREFDLKLTIQGLTADSITASHIHTGAVGVNGPIIFDLGSGSQYTSNGTQIQRGIDDGIFPSANTNALFSRNTYINVHTDDHPDGEIRGELSPFQNGLYQNLPTTTTDQLVVIDSFSGDGEVRGTVYADVDEDGTRDEDEIGVENVSIYSDLNANQECDSGEPVATTNSNGQYVLRLPSGQHRIRIVPSERFEQPILGDSYNVTVQIGRQITGRDFAISRFLQEPGSNGPHDGDPTYDLNNFHIHATLAIYVNGEKVEIPVWGGRTGGDEIHTHDTNNLIHIHPLAPRTSYVKLGEVFQKWRVAPQNGNPNAIFNQDNLLNNVVDETHDLYMFVNGVRSDAYQNYQIHDGDEIILAYSANPIVTVNTNLGRIPVELFADKTPITVDNFLTYVNDGDYTSSIFHRYVPGFVLQGGGFKTPTSSFADPSVVNSFTAIETNSPIQNEFNNLAKVTGDAAVITAGNALIQLDSNADLSKVVVGDSLRLIGRTDGLDGSDLFRIVTVNDSENTVTVHQVPSSPGNLVAWKIFPRVNVAGTIGMAKIGGDPNSATSQFFLNLVDNDENLDLQNGGFTVFGQILDRSILTDISLLNELRLFSGILNGNQEVPPVTTDATGSATLALNKLNNHFDLMLKVQELTASEIIGSHLHHGALGVDGPIVFDFGSGEQYIVDGNQLRRFIDNGALTPEAVQALMSIQGNRTYINIHTAANPDGEIRGQLTSFQGGLYSDLPTTTGDQLVVIESFSGDGIVRGVVFRDTDEDGSRDVNEIGLDHVVVYSDINDNQQFDRGEPATSANVRGSYALRLSPGDHAIRIVSPSGFAQTLPSESIDVAVQIGRQVTGRDFGLASDLREWRNPVNHRDVTNDGFVVPIDVLVLLNAINGKRNSDPVTGRLAERSNSQLPYYDVNGDNFLTTQDALNVINYLNARDAEGESVASDNRTPDPSISFAVDRAVVDRFIFGNLATSTDEDAGNSSCAVDDDYWDDLISQIARDCSDN